MIYCKHKLSPPNTDSDTTTKIKINTSALMQTCTGNIPKLPDYLTQMAV